jgi:hypothetical protein
MMYSRNADMTSVGAVVVVVAASRLRRTAVVFR